MFKDPDFGSNQTVDKRGRTVGSAFTCVPGRSAWHTGGDSAIQLRTLLQVKRTKHKEDMRRYYRLQGEVRRRCD